MPKKTPLFDEHVKLKARMVDFAGWEMPVSYSGIIDEHLAVRSAAGLFDVSHMGIAEVSGDGALPFLQKITTNDASKLEPFRSQYTIICNQRGGVVDDILLYRLPDKYMLVLNASNTGKDLDWMKKHNEGRVDVRHRKDLCLLSLQGPKSELILSPICDITLTPLKRNHCARGRVLEKECLVSRTGYTGGDGFELLLGGSAAPEVWRALVERGAKPCGLGARDSLRIEAALPLYGHEYSEDISPIEAGYRWAVKFEKGSFIGKEALKNKLPDRKMAGIALDERAIPRNGAGVFSDRKMTRQIGELTSGSFSPVLNASLGLAYLDPGAGPGGEVWINIRNRAFRGEVRKLPFYSQKNKEVNNAVSQR